MKMITDGTKFTVTIPYSLDELKKALAFYQGDKNWRKVKKSDVAQWVSSLAQADIECDIGRAIEFFEA